MRDRTQNPSRQRHRPRCPRASSRLCSGAPRLLPGSGAPRLLPGSGAPVGASSPALLWWPWGKSSSWPTTKRTASTASGALRQSVVSTPSSGRQICALCHCWPSWAPTPPRWSAGSPWGPPATSSVRAASRGSPAFWPRSPSRRSPNALVGPVLPIHVLLALEEKSKDAESPSQGVPIETDSINDRCREVFEALDPVISIADTDNDNGWPASQDLDEGKPYFSYEPQIKHMFSMGRSTRKEEKEDQNQDDLHTSSTLYEDKVFTTFICGKAKVPDSPEQAATLLDFGQVRMDFDTPAMEIQPAEKKVYKCLRKQFVTWQNNFKPYKDFCSSHKIPKPKQ